MNTPKQEYGFILIDTDEKREQFAPRLESDEKWDGGRWCRTNRAIFSIDNIYRRRIDPGEGWEIVPKEAVYTANCNWEFWDEGWQSFGRGGYGFSAQEWCYDNPVVLAFRREIVAKEHDGWVSVAKLPPVSGITVELAWQAKDSTHPDKWMCSTWKSDEELAFEEAINNAGRKHFCESELRRAKIIWGAAIDFAKRDPVFQKDREFKEK